MSPIPSARVLDGIKSKVITLTNSHRLLRLNLCRKLRRSSKVFIFICVYLLRLLQRFLPEVDRHPPGLLGTFRPARDRLQSKVRLSAALATDLATTTDTHVPAHRSS